MNFLMERKTWSASQGDSVSRVAPGFSGTSSGRLTLGNVNNLCQTKIDARKASLIDTAAVCSAMLTLARSLANVDLAMANNIPFIFLSICHIKQFSILLSRAALQLRRYIKSW